MFENLAQGPGPGKYGRKTGIPMGCRPVLRGAATGMSGSGIMRGAWLRRMVSECVHILPPPCKSQLPALKDRHLHSKY